MAVIPRSTIGRAFLALYVLACAGMLYFAWRQREIHDMPEALFALMNFFTFPLGFLAAMILGIAAFALEGVFRDVPYDPFLSVLPLWTILAVAGWVQWLVLVPWAWRRIEVFVRRGG